METAGRKEYPSEHRRPGEDQEILKSRSYSWESWWEYIYKHEDDIVITARRERESREHLRRKEALQDRIANTKELPEEKILNRANAVYFHNGHYLYYKIKGSWAQIACSACGGVTDERWKEGESFESMFQRRIEKPREGYYGTCPLCGARGRYKCKGKVKGSTAKQSICSWGRDTKKMNGLPVCAGGEKMDTGACLRGERNRDVQCLRRVVWSRDCKGIF